MRDSFDTLYSERLNNRVGYHQRNLNNAYMTIHRKYKDTDEENFKKIVNTIIS